MTLRDQLKIDEGIRTKMYRDIVGVYTAGVGRNLEAVAFSDDEIELMLTNDINRALAACRALFPMFDTFPQAKQDALANMAFNLGRRRLSMFANMIAAVNRNDWAGAARAAVSSKWYQQVGNRAKRIVQVFLGDDK